MRKQQSPIWIMGVVFPARLTGRDREKLTNHNQESLGAGAGAGKGGGDDRRKAYIKLQREEKKIGSGGDEGLIVTM